MKLQISALDVRLESESRTYKEKIAFQTKCQQVINFVDNLPWFKNSIGESSTKDPHCEVSTFVWNRLSFNMDEIPLEDAIEYILGPIHREFDIFWDLELEGSVSDPVFKFSIADEWTSWLEIHVKEGAFQSCKISKEIDFIEEAKIATKHFKLQMVCE
jgi:hypothetical protein